jgi:methionyl-tRNA formyltransferase
MRVIFAGTPVFAASSLNALLAAGHAVPLVLTQPDRNAGRGMALQTTPVKQLALNRGLALYQPTSLKTNDTWERILEAGADVMIVAAYGLILPQAVLDLPRLGCLNIHASLLPRWRGAAPIQRAILAGDAETGITIMQMDAGLDTGAMLLSRGIGIAHDDTTGSLHDKLAALGALLIVDALERLAHGALPAVAQPDDGITYAAKIDKAEARLDWRRPAIELNRAVRAFNPVPGAAAELEGAALKIWLADAQPENGEPGTVLSADGNGIVVACGQGTLRILELQKAGGKRLPAGEFLRGMPIPVGARLAIAAD